MRSAFEAGNAFVFLSAQPTSPGIHCRPSPLGRVQSHTWLRLIGQLALGASSVGHTDLMHCVPCQERPDARVTDSTSPKPWALGFPAAGFTRGDLEHFPSPIRGAPGP